MTMDSNAIREAATLAIEENSALVARWMAGEPGSWGPLAGKAVIACRQKLGRKLTDFERRQVWSLLWNNLVELKNESN